MKRANSVDFVDQVKSTAPVQAKNCVNFSKVHALLHLNVLFVCAIDVVQCVVQLLQ